MKQKSVLVLLLSLWALSFLNVRAQSLSDRWYIGTGVGYHYSSLLFSDITKDDYESKQGANSAEFSIWTQLHLGNKGQFGIRPELSFLNRGGKLIDLVKGKDLYDYTIKAHYTDFRVQLAYHLGEWDAKIRPYVFATPYFSFVHGGQISLEQVTPIVLTTKDNEYGQTYAGVRTDVTNANMSSAQFGIGLGAGAKYQFYAGKKHQDLCFLGLELGYEIGLGNTYSGKETQKYMTGEDRPINLVGTQRYKVSSRKFNGFSMKVVVGIPLSVFKKKNVETIYAPKEVEVQPIIQETAEEKTCYSLEEIEGLIVSGKSVKGKTICAVNDINFDFGKSKIKSNSYEYLNRLAKTINRTGSRIIIKGHTDNVGSDETNMKLSEARAKAVKNYLVKKGVNESLLEYEFYGASRPLTDNDSDAGRSINRRVEFEIIQ